MVDLRSTTVVFHAPSLRSLLSLMEGKSIRDVITKQMSISFDRLFYVQAGGQVRVACHTLIVR